MPKTRISFRYEGGPWQYAFSYYTNIQVTTVPKLVLTYKAVVNLLAQPSNKCERRETSGRERDLPVTLVLPVTGTFSGSGPDGQVCKGGNIVASFNYRDATGKTGSMVVENEASSSTYFWREFVVEKIEKRCLLTIRDSKGVIYTKLTPGACPEWRIGCPPNTVACGRCCIPCLELSAQIKQAIKSLSEV